MNSSPKYTGCVKFLADLIERLPEIFFVANDDGAPAGLLRQFLCYAFVATEARIGY